MPKAKAKPKTKVKLPVVDVVDADQTQPEDTSRPLIVSNHVLMTTDPMVAGGADTIATLPSAPPLARTGKSLQPIVNDVLPAGSGDTETKPINEPQLSAAPPLKLDSAAADSPKVDQEVLSITKEPIVKAEATIVPAEEKTDDPIGQQVEPDELAKTTVDAAAQEKLAAAEAAHRDQLAKLIESGRYHVPINAVQKRRTLHTSLGLTLLVIVLAVLLIDLMLDANLIELIQKLPHTHFFESK